MNQDEIYNLLLILLLMSNERDGSDDFTQTTRGALNEIILTALLINGRNPEDSDTRTQNNNCSCPRTRQNGNTTF